MRKPIAGHAVVVGAGMGGLAAAAALAPYAARVTVLDRDAPPADASGRPGVGQGPHCHQLLKGGELALERILPGFTKALYAAGAVSMRGGQDIELLDFGGVMPDVDVGFSVAALSRPAYESVLRAMAVARVNVTLRGESPVTRFRVEAGRCVGVLLEDGQRLDADLIIDATGMNAPLAGRLVEDGHADFETESLKINVAYTSGRFIQPEAFRGETRGFFVLPGPPDPYFGLLMPVENNQWVVSLGARGPVAPPRDLAAFRAYARQYPTPEIFTRIRAAEPVGELRTFRKVVAERRRYDAAAKWPDRLVPLGDAMSHVNPTYGQGMSVAALQADTLRRMLVGRETLDGLAADYLPAAFEIADRAWTLAVNSDYVYDATEGERPANFAVSRAVAGVLRKLCNSDPEFAVFRYRLAHMLETNDGLRTGPLAVKFFTALQGALAA